MGPNRINILQLQDTVIILTMESVVMKNVWAGNAFLNTYKHHNVILMEIAQEKSACIHTQNKMEEILVF